MLGALAAVSFATAVPALGTPAAHAAALNVCAGTEIATYTPPLRIAAAPTTVRATGSLTCVGDPSHPAAAVSFVGTGTLSCLTGGTTSGTGRFDWSDKHRTHSGFTFTLAIGARPAGEEVLVATGTVVSGDYSGEPVTFTFTLIDTDPTNCLLGPGVAGDSGPLTAGIGA